MTIWNEPTAALLAMDAKTTATPLGILKEEGIGKLVEVFGDKISLYTHLLIGNRAGSIGETSAIAILIGGLFLLFREIYYLAYTGIFSRDGCGYRMGIRRKRRPFHRGPDHPSDQRRHDARRMVYGH